MAYCLLGRFDVNIPLIYGEGRKAFARLQEQIIAQSSDESDIAWTSPTAVTHKGMLATWPSEFARSGNVHKVDLKPSRPPFKFTERTVRIAAVTTVVLCWRGWIASANSTRLYVRLACGTYKQQGSSPKTILLHLGRRAPTDEVWYRMSSSK